MLSVPLVAEARMKGRQVVVVVVLTLLTVAMATTTVGTEADSLEESEWSTAEAFKVEVQDWFANPARRALEGLPGRLLMDNGGQEKK